MATSELREIPCKIGEEVVFLREYYGTPVLRRGRVSQMFFVGEEMALCIVVSGVARGEWGKTVFSSDEEAKKALEGVANEQRNNTRKV